MFPLGVVVPPQLLLLPEHRILLVAPAITSLRIMEHEPRLAISKKTVFVTDLNALLYRGI